MSSLTREGWLERDASLRGIADFCERVDRAASDLGSHSPVITSLDEHREDFLAGVPLLRSQGAPIDLEPAGKIVGLLIQRLASDASLEKQNDEVAALDAAFRVP